MTSEKIKLGCLITALLLPSWVSAKVVTTNELIESIKLNHPKLMMLNAGEQQNIEAINSAQGAFDLRLKQDTKLKTTGYYDGKYLSQKVEKPLRFMGGEVSSEYRISDGEFPIYDGEYDTSSAGEASVALELSLLQNRDIDKRRAILCFMKAYPVTLIGMKQVFVSVIWKN
jgi:hypothetical protein